MTSAVETPPSPAASGVDAAAAPAPAEARPAPWRVALLALIAGGFGVSALADGLHSISQWGPAALAVLGLLFTLVVATPARPSRPALLALAGLLGLAAWSLLSALWAESADRAVLEGNRWALYAATFAVLVILVRRPRHASIAIGCATAAILGVSLYLLGVMLSGDVGSLFSEKRFVGPLGYGNGQASYFLLGIWPLLAVAETARRRLVAGLTLSAAFVLAALLAATQTRGAVAAFVVAAAVLLAAVPGRVRRAWLLITLVVGVAAATPALLDVLPEPTPGALRTAAVAILVAAPLVGLAWALGDVAVGRVAARLSPARLSRGGGLLAGLLAAALLAAGVASLSDPVGTVKQKWESFSHSRPDQASTRFLSAGGLRYDYWRIAVLQFRQDPLKGAGAGSYPRAYFAHRRTADSVRQPHSLPLQALAELGVPGALAVLVFVGGVLLGLARTARRARVGRPERFLVVAGGGTFLVWLVHTSVDWLHLIPALTGIALVAAAAVVLPEGRGGASPRRRLPRAAVPLACGVAVALAAVLVGRQTAAELYRLDARDALAAGRPQAALERANTALSLNGKSVEARYLKAAALARLNAYVQARRTLEQAAETEPTNFVTWALFGDLLVRGGELERARGAYATALSFNPREPALLEAANDPRLQAPERAR